MSVKIAGTDYEVTEMAPEAWESYRAYLVENAKRRDRPIERFIRQQCGGLTRDERQDVLAAWMRTRGWDDPPESLIRELERHPNAIASLCARVLRPEHSAAEWVSIIAQDDAQAAHKAVLEALKPEPEPTIDDIMAKNAELRKIINRGGSPCQDQPQPTAAQAMGDEPAKP